jgi:hypothetical protein
MSLDVIALGKANRAYQSKALGLAQATGATGTGLTSGTPDILLVAMAKITRLDAPVLVRAHIPKLYNDTATKAAYCRLSHYTSGGRAVIAEDSWPCTTGGSSDFKTVTMQRIVKMYELGETMFSLDWYTDSGGTARVGAGSGSSIPVTLEAVTL